MKQHFSPMPIKFTYKDLFNSMSLANTCNNRSVQLIKADEAEMKIDERTDAVFRGTSSSQLSFIHFEIPPMRYFADRLHPNEVMIFNIRGELILNMNGKTMIIEPGDIAYIPPNTLYDISTGNLGAVAVEVLSAEMN